MNLPPLVIPNIPLPIEIPQILHPIFVHFAIALPVVVLLLEIINLFSKKRTVGVLSFVFMVLISVVFLAAYLTGSTDGKAAIDALSPQAKETLLAHKQLGIYLVYASGVLMLFKLFSVLIRKVVFRVLFFLALILFVVAVFNEGKKGGELVYQHGVNVKSSPTIPASKAQESNHKSNDTKETPKKTVSEEKTQHTQKSSSEKAEVTTDSKQEYNNKTQPKKENSEQAEKTDSNKTAKESTKTTQESEHTQEKKAETKETNNTEQ